MHIYICWQNVSAYGERVTLSATAGQHERSVCLFVCFFFINEQCENSEEVGKEWETDLTVT